MKTFKFYCGEENGEVIEDRHYTESLFKDQYIQALTALERILEHPSNENPDIISFCGERGEGKTSCMRSFIKLLEGLDKTESDARSFLASCEIPDDLLVDSSLYEYCNKVIGTKYEVLDVIDPAFFDVNHNVLELILGQMYGNILDVIENTEEERTQEEKNKILGSFHDAKLCWTRMSKGIDTMYDPLEELDSLSAALTLRNKMQKLIEDYLNFISKNSSNSRLVICIDDLDLNISEAYAMVEQIRKYLVSDKCIILISLNITQLVEVIAHSIKRIVSTEFSSNFMQMSVQYVTKLLPLERRIYMPKVYAFCDNKIIIYENRNVGTYLYSFNSIKEAVVQLIYKKTRLLFYNLRGGVSPIVPNNLRNLRHLLGLLNAMPDFVCHSKSSANEMIFLSYFFQTWTKNLTKSDQEFVKLLVERNDSTAINKLVISYLGKYLPNKSKDDLIISEIINPGNYCYNVSVGDVFYLLRYLESSNVNEEFRLMLFFIKTFYSIRLNEYYNIISDEIGNIYPENNSYITNLSGEYNLYSHINLMQRFVNGSYFTYLPNKILPATKDGKSRDLIIISGNLLNTLIFHDIKNAIGIYDKLNDNSKIEFKEKFVIAEFLALTLKESMTKKNLKNEGVAERTDSEAFYLKSYTSYTSYYLFDVLAPFYNLLNPQFAYEKFSILRNNEDPLDFYNFALSHSWSLLHKMIDLASNKKIDDKSNYSSENVHDFMQSSLDEKGGTNTVDAKELVSDVCIRNGEILLELMDAIQNKRNNGYDSGNTLSIISSLYKLISNLRIKTYEQSPYLCPYSIRFAFLEVFSDLLDLENKKGVDSLLFKILSSEIENIEYTDEQILNYFAKFFNSFSSYKYGRNIIKDFKEIYFNFFSFLPERYWEDLFVSDVRYTKFDILNKLKTDFIKYMNKIL